MPPTRPSKSKPFVPASLNDVAAALAETPDPAPSAAPPVASFELPEETLRFAANGGAVERPETELEPDPLTETDLPTATRVGNWALRDKNNDNLVVDVTADEKDIYLKAVLFDKPVTFDIPVLDGRLMVKVRTLDETEEALVTAAVRLADAAYRAAEGLTEKQAPTGMMLYVTWMQRFKTLLRVVEYTPVLDDQKHGETKRMPQLKKTARSTSEQMAKQLLEHAETVFGKMNPALYTALITAVRVHELKFTLCSTKAASRNFWSPAGTN